MSGVFGIVLSLFLLMYLAYRGITVLILAPILSLLAVLVSGGVPEAGQHVLIAGSVGPQIIHLAGQVEADLIVVGSRGRHGLALLLGGSTPDEVFHGARRDVLAVYLPR